MGMNGMARETGVGGVARVDDWGSTCGGSGTLEAVWLVVAPSANGSTVRACVEWICTRVQAHSDIIICNVS